MQQRTLGLLRGFRSQSAAQLQNQTHNQILNLIANRNIDILRTPDRILHLPITYLNRDACRKLHATHVDEEIKIADSERTQVFRGLTFELDVLLLHYLMRQWLYDSRRRESRACNFH